MAIVLDLDGHYGRACPLSTNSSDTSFILLAAFQTFSIFINLTFISPAPSHLIHFEIESVCLNKRKYYLLPTGSFLTANRV